MVAHLLQPLADRLEGDSPREVVDQEHADGLAIVGIRDCSVPLLASRVPDLRPDEHVLDFDVVRGELDANRRVCLPLELVFRITVEQLGLAHLGVPNEHQLKHVVVGRALLLVEEVLLCHVSSL